jgi:hypothetical protein
MELQQQQIEIALRRVGLTTADQLRWLLRFAEQDLKQLYPEERAALGHDLRLLPIAIKQAGQAGDTPAVTHSSRPNAPMDETVLQRIHHEIRSGLKKLLAVDPADRETWTFPFPESVGLGGWVDRNTKRVNFTLVTRFATRDETTIIMNAVMSLLLTAQGLARNCTTCRKPFVPVGRQEYCSPVCSQRARDSRRQKPVKKTKAIKKKKKA